MTGPRIGSICSGYGGLEQGVQAVYGGTTAWVSDIDKGACKVLTHRFPGVPNMGDMTAVDWSTVEPVDILCGGTPCQDLSHAGKRAGMTEGTRSNLWVAMREAVAALRPSLVVWENVAGAYSAEADSELESDPRLLAGTRRRDGEPVLRALGRVLGDLCTLGYDTSWHGLRAADVGAAHGRYRVFVTAWPADSTSDPGRLVHGDSEDAAADASRLRRGQGWATGPRETSSWRSSTDIAGRGNTSLNLLPTPMSRDWKGAGPVEARRHDPNLSAVTYLLPTPAVNDMGEGKTVEAWDEWTAKMKAAHGNGTGHGASLAIEAQRLLPTPRGAADRTGRSAALRRDSMSAPSLGQAIEISEGVLPREFDSWSDLPPSWQLGDVTGRWGQYAAAISRWESRTRPAPPPTEPGANGQPRLSPRFSEWLMGLPDGWITDVPGVTRNEALRLAGNGVVPQQAAEALRVMAGWVVAA